MLRATYVCGGAMNKVLLAVLLVMGGGCMSRIRQAEQLAEQERFVEAAELLERLAKDDPRNPELPRALERARFLAVEHALTQARRSRLAGDAAASQRHFATGLALRKRWNVKLSGALESTVEEEREDAAARLRRLVMPRAEKGEALAAEAIVRAHYFLLDHEELRALRAELEAAVSQSGGSSCVRLLGTTGPAEPYWSSLVAQYCHHFRERGPVESNLPDAFSTAQSSVGIQSLGDGLSGVLKGLLEAELRRSPWFSEKGPRSATLQVEGRTQLQVRQDWVPLYAEWTEQVPYQVEVKKELKERVPVTECETYEESNSSAPGGRVTRVREVKREREAKREVMVKETRFREVPRSFEYRALRIDRVLEFSARAELKVQGEVVASSGHQQTEARHGYQHEVTFAPAGVRPTSTSFGSPESWFAENLRRAANELGAGMRVGWRARFCRAKSYSPEEAARCARVAEAVPAEAISALRPRLGEDADQVPGLMATLPAEFPDVGRGESGDLPGSSRAGTALTAGTPR